MVPVSLIFFGRSAAILNFVGLRHLLVFAGRSGAFFAFSILLSVSMLRYCLVRTSPPRTLQCNSSTLEVCQGVRVTMAGFVLLRRGLGPSRNCYIPRSRTWHSREFRPARNGSLSMCSLYTFLDSSLAFFVNRKSIYTLHKLSLLFSWTLWYSFSQSIIV